MKKSRLYILLGVSLAAIGTSLLLYLIFPGKMVPTWNIMSVFDQEYPDHLVGKSVKILDEAGNEISRAARYVSIGDGIIKPDGKSYKISRVDGETAYAEYQGQDHEFLAWQEYFNNHEIPVAAQQKRDLVGIYHTHSDEAYVPSDGKESVPFKGGIYQVGQSFTDKLKAEGVQVLFNKTPHDPHDNNAYYRSRRTAVELMKNNPVAIFDVHRDGIPDANYYSKQISGQDVTQLRLVIGRQNPKMNSNMDFAKRLMAYANEVHPTLVKEIFIGKGNYNQDLMSTALLIEAGTHTNNKEAAERGVSLLAEVVPVVLGINNPTKPEPTASPTERTPGAWKALGWIIGITILGAGAFLLFSSGGFDKAKSRLSKFGGSEMSNFFGPAIRRKKAEPKKMTDEKINDNSSPLDKDTLRDARDELTKD
ncbi:stage II sporulation protein P [Desulfolucanica intricata]|uniref:stage II sporulation protein P n=1 Tax=Desulfolucanica intricata TaxID=1285191 RepID=UPI00082AF8A1|nr:stage II sporulation protein P [Desulfolucanica intricata]